MENFLSIMEGQKPSITEQLSKDNQVAADRNRQVLERLMEVLRNCVEKGTALRGHRDDGAPSIDEDDYVNIGNFKADVVSRAKFDVVLSDHLKKCETSTYATYLSKYAQEDFVECIRQGINEAVQAEARKQTGKFIFSVSADEVTDVSNQEQMAIVIRTVGTGGKIRERLIEYVDMDSITGKSVSDAIISCLERHNMSIMDCRAQTYDGAANMSGKFNGAQALITNMQPLAVFTHCASHRLNLALNATSKVSEFRVMMDNVRKIGVFFKNSPKRTKVMERTLAAATPPVAVKKVDSLEQVPIHGHSAI